MTIIGFNFTKLLAYQKKSAKGKLKIGTNVKVDDVQKTNLAFGDERGAVKVSFTYLVKYDPEVGGIELQGELLFMQEQKVIDALLKEWETKSSLPKKLSAALINAIMQKSMLQSLIMTRDIGLPPPMPMPKVRPSGSVSVKADAEVPVDDNPAERK